MDLQGLDAVSRHYERVRDLDRASGKAPAHPAHDNKMIAAMAGAQGLDGIRIFFSCGIDPGLNGRDAPMRMPFVDHGGVRCETGRQGRVIGPIADGEVGDDRNGKLWDHGGEFEVQVKEIWVTQTPRTRTHEKVSDLPVRKVYTPDAAAVDVAGALHLLEGRWKLALLFHLFDGKVQRYSDLERLIPGISQKMLAQQLRQLEADGLVTRTVHPEVPPKVEYRLTEWGQALCPALDALLLWTEQRPAAT